MENFLEDLCLEQVRQGHRVHVLCHWHLRGQPTRKESIQPGFELTRVRILGVVAYAPLAPGFPGCLLNLLRSFAPDVLQVHMPNSSAFALLLLRRLPRLVIHWHSDVLGSDLDRKLKLLYPLYRVFEKRLLQKAQAIIATSRPYLDTSPALQSFRDKCQVIPLGISFQKMKALQQSAQLEKLAAQISAKGLQQTNDLDMHGFILSVGRFTYYKGFEYLLQACAEGFSGRLILVGSGPKKEHLQGLRHKLGLEEQVQMLGSLHTEQLHWLLQHCSVFCLPSIERTEAFGLVLLEAMYYGKPLITTSVRGSGMNQVNIHGQTGLVVPPGNPQELARSMDLLLKDQDLAQTLGQNSKMRLHRRFSISTVANKLEEIY